MSNIVWDCCNCNFITDEFYGDDRVTWRETIRILIDKIPHRLCLQCINSGINLERKTQDMKIFLKEMT